MTLQYMLGILVLTGCSLIQVSTFPSNNEATSVENSTDAQEEKEERSLTYDETNIEKDDTMKDIIKKIMAINEALKKPNKKQHVQWSAPPQTSGGYTLDKETLEKLQQVIASGKLQPYSDMKQHETNAIINEDLGDIRYSRQISPLMPGNQIMPPMAYMTNMPVMVMPSTNNMYSYRNSLEYGPQYQTREGPFGQFPWPFAPVFPILIRDPLLSILNGGGFQNFIEVGQSADVCNRKQKSEDSVYYINENEGIEKTANRLLKSSKKGKSRGKRAIKKRTVSLENHVLDTNKANKFFSIKPTTTKPTKPEQLKITKTADDNEGDFRFPFLFGHKEKQPGPGLFINRLKVRKGGVAIAGPGGVATAGRGGTAIVGPGGLAYTQPGGIAVAGPAARVIAISPEVDLTSIANRLQQQSTINGSVSQLLRAIPEGKLVATGPVIYFHPNNR
ncbi:unnamed protein product [Arctia plantaginis]|uniref:DUF4774 domain-containing protein n=1 Tax=Arctia plantaginis TaxID=874455 RepID=A0A8S0Z6X4_ARCPL|nr:unnamed protein product [Arctia plantaginis]